MAAMKDVLEKAAPKHQREVCIFENKCDWKYFLLHSE